MGGLQQVEAPPLWGEGIAALTCTSSRVLPWLVAMRNKTRWLWTCAAPLCLIACFSGGAAELDLDGGPTGAIDGADAAPGWVPLAPTTDVFGWQGVQRRLAMSNQPGVTCRQADIVLAMWDRASCFVRVDNELMCAGRVGSTVFGPSFVQAGMSDVVQLLGSPTFNSDTGSSACVLKTDGTAFCLGNSTNWGQFQTADGQLPGATWTRWGTRDDITELATNSMQTICATYQDKTAECFGLNAQPIDDSNVRSLWIDTSGAVHLNDAQVFRVSNSTPSCVVAPGGMFCTEPPELIMKLFDQGAPESEYGTLVSPTSEGGKIVDGNWADEHSACWLTARGKVFCRVSPADDPEAPPITTEPFAGHHAVALAINGYSNGKDRCAAMRDGSLWCVGANLFGKFGTGDMAPLASATEVQPTGSVRIRCGPP